MGFPAEKFDHSKQNYLQKCFYVMNLIKDLDQDLWENFQGQYSATKPEESWELYQIIVEEYRKLSAPKAKAQVKKSAPRKKAAPKKK